MAFSVYHFNPDNHDAIFSAFRSLKQHDEWKDEDDKTVIVGFGTSNYSESDVVPFSLQHITSVLARIFRKHCSTKSVGISVFGLKQQLIALQLVMAQRNKKLTGEFTVGVDEVIEAHEQITKLKLDLVQNEESTALLRDLYNDFLSNSNAVDYADLVQRVRTCFSQDESTRELYQTGFQYVIAGKPDTVVEVEMLKLLIGQKEVICTTTNTGDKNFVIKSVEELAREICQLSQGNIKTVSSPPRQSIVNTLSSPGEVQKSQILQVMLSYLRLLVNSRDELALSQVVNVPCRGLGRKEFTTIRKLAREKNMTMYQTVVSFILKVRLGGKSYAPSSGHPFFSFTKGLAEFVAYFQKLQNVLEETPQPEDAVVKVINALKVSLIRAKEKHFQAETINEVSQMLQQKLKNIARRRLDFDTQETRKCKLVGAETIFLIQRLLDKNHCQMSLHSDKIQELYNVLSTPETTQGPSKLHSALTHFRTPDSSSPDVSPLQIRPKESPRKNKRDQQKIDQRRMCGDMSWAKPAVCIGFSQHTNTLASSDNNDVNIQEQLAPSPNREQCPYKFSETPKSRARKRPRESAYDKENIQPSKCEGKPCPGKGKTVQDSPSKPLAKRLMLRQDNAVAKAKKTSKASTSVKTKKKTVALLQGQKQMTHFFRV